MKREYRIDEMDSGRYVSALVGVDSRAISLTNSTPSVSPPLFGGEKSEQICGFNSWPFRRGTDEVLFALKRTMRIAGQISERPFHGTSNIGRFHRLGDVPIHSGGQATILVSPHDPGGQRDDRDVPAG